MRVENQPYGRLPEIIYDQAFTVHPYKHPTIGSMADLEAASIDDVRDFYRTYYVPSNATLAIVGDFDPAQALQLGHAVPRPRPEGRAAGAARHPDRAAADRRSGASRCEEAGRCRPWSSRYHITYDGHPDSYPLHMASKILSDGQSSRIYRKLVYENGHRARGVRRRQHHRAPEPVLRGGDRAAGPDARGGREGAHRRARPAADRAGHRARAAARQEPVRPRLHPAAARPISRRRRQLAHAVVIHNDITTADGEFEIFTEHHGRRRPARGRRRTSRRRTGSCLTILPQDAVGPADTAGAAMSHAVIEPWIGAAPAGVVRRRAGVGPVAQRPDRRTGRSERPPQPLAARDVKFPPYEIRTLPNGLQVSSSSHHEQPVVSLRLLVRAGCASGSRRTSPASRRSRPRCSTRGRRAGRRSRSPTRSTRSAAALGTGAGSRPELRQRRRHEGQPRTLGSTCCRTWCGIRRSRPRRSSGSGSRRCRG